MEIVLFTISHEFEYRRGIFFNHFKIYVLVWFGILGIIVTFNDTLRFVIADVIKPFIGSASYFCH